MGLVDSDRPFAGDPRPFAAIGRRGARAQCWIGIMDAALRPRWSYLLFPQLALIFVVTLLAATNHLRFAFLALPGVDKLAHFALYGLLALFSVGFFGRARWWRIAVLLAVLAAFEEYSQSFFPARTFDLGDLAATVAGIVLFARAAGPVD